MSRRKGVQQLSRAALWALCLSISIGGCGTTITSSPKNSSDGTVRCDAQKLDVCEQSIVASMREGRDTKSLLDAYAEARGAKDPWATLWKDARSSSQTQAAIVIEVGVNIPADRIPTKHHVVRTAPLPSPAAIPTGALLEAMGDAAGWTTIVHVRRPSATEARESLPPEVTEVFPNDPLAPFMAGLPPVVRDDDAIQHLEADIDLAASIRAAVDHASLFRYVEAAREAERIEQTLRSRDANAEPTLRAKYLLSLLNGAGITLELPAGASSTPSADPTLPDPSRATPYGDLLRVRATKDDRAMFRTVSERLVAALPEDKRLAMRALYAPEEACLTVPLDAFDAPDDLFLAYLVGRRLAPSLVPSAGARGMELTTWLPKYEALVRSVDDARTTWVHAFALTQERGEVGGISLAMTPTHRRVDSLLQAHLAALSQIVQTYPERARLMSIVTLAYARGIVGTPALRDALVDLLRRAVETRISRAPDTSALFEATLAGVLAATAYPQAIQGPVYGGLFSAFRGKLKKDFSTQTGWGVAGLFAADAAAGFLTGDRPDLGPIASEISRALADPSLPERPLGRLASAAARYLALGLSHELDPDAVDPARWPRERKAARDALREAVAGLSDAAAPLSAGLIDDVTMLGDQTMTALAAVLQDKPASSGPVCANSDAGPSPAARRVLARVGDLRRKILANPALAKGATGVGRVRLAITVLSDAIDIASRKKKDSPVVFTVSDADAERAMTDALATWDERAIGDVIGSGYGIARRFLAGSGSKGLVGADVDRARKLVLSLATLFRDENTGTSVTLFDALARAASSRPRDGAADPPVELLLVDYARTLRKLGKPDQADLCLLGAMVVAVIGERGVRDEAIEVANEASSDLGWTLRFAREVFRARKGLSPDPSAYAKGMRDAVARSCEDPAVADQVVQVMDAIRLASSGQRTKARSMLDEFLTKAEERGFSLPRMSYKYEEKTVSKVFSTSLEVSLGAGFLDGSSRFQVGLAVRSPGQPEGSLVARLMPEGSERDAEVVRYYVHVGAAAALFHFLDGDPERGAATAARIVDAAFFGPRLGGRALAADPKTTAADARGVLAAVAVLAADAGMPLLAGDLWTLVGSTLAPDTDDRAVDDILGNLPISLSAVATVKPPIDKAKRGLRVVAEPLACTEQKVELGGFEAPACDEYPFALSLRAGGALRKLPHLRRDPGKPCAAALSAVDTFLVGVEKGAYDPDAFTRAVNELVTAGRAYDAAVLLARQRQPTHCNQSLVTAARAIGRSPAVGRSLRADVLSVAVNCSLLDEATLADLTLVDTETSMQADRGRNLSLLVFAAELGVARGRWDVLGRLTKSPTFVSRWLDTNPRVALFAVVLAQAAAIVAKEPSAAAAASSAFDLFCVKLPKTDAAACEAVEAMRRAAGSADAERIAKDSVAAALQRVSALRAKR